METSNSNGQADLQQYKSAGVFVISLDFELHWGVRDHLSIDQYKRNLLGVREAVPAMLALFREFDIHATWATVGFLFFESKQELLRAVPTVVPEYANPVLSPYADLDRIGANEQEDPFHFAPNLIREIQRTPGQEIASHTFSHYYCLENGQDRRAFEADMKAAQAAAARFGIVLQSLVLPRNQVNMEYLPVLRDAGFRCYRGDAPGWFVRGVAKERESKIRRLLRLADAYVPIRRSTTFTIEDCGSEAPANVAASRYLRPWTAGSSKLDFLLVRRICRELTEAAERGRVYHLWWHPHNFGADPRENIARMRRILDHFSKLRQSRGLRSLSMNEVADLAMKAAVGQPALVER